MLDKIVVVLVVEPVFGTNITMNAGIGCRGFGLGVYGSGAVCIPVLHMCETSSPKTWALKP